MLRMKFVPGGSSAVAQFSSTFFAQFHIITPTRTVLTSNFFLLQLISVSQAKI